MSRGGGACLRRWVANIALAAAFTILVLAGAEIAARVYVRHVEGAPGTIARPLAVFDPELGWAKPAGASAVIQRIEFRVHEAINAHGLRGPDRPYDKAAGVRRVLLLGDSFTEEADVEEEQTMRAVLETRLRARGSGPWEVINAGTAGYSTDQEYLFYRREGARYHADVVVVVFYYNDLYALLGSEGGKPYFEVRDGALVLRNSPVPPPDAQWGRDRRSRFVLRPWRHSFALSLLSARTAAGNPELHRMLARVGLTDSFDDTPPPEMWPYGLGHRDEVLEMWRRVAALLAALRADVDAAGGHLVLLYAPAAFECDERAWDLTRRRYRFGRRWDRDRVAGDLAAAAAELGIPLVDPRPEFRAALAGGRPPHFPLDGHWKVVGDELAAKPWRARSRTAERAVLPCVRAMLRLNSHRNPSLGRSAPLRLLLARRRCTVRRRAIVLGVLSSAAQLCLVSGEARAQVKAGPEFRVNTYTTGYQNRPIVAANARGDFVVVWTSQSQRGVFAQRYDPTGAPRGGEFQVTTYTTNLGFGSVALDGIGNFVVAWSGFGQDGSSTGVFGRRFDANGAPRGAEFRVNTYTTNYQFGPSVAMDPVGRFVVTWTSVSQDGSSYGVFAQRYDVAGNAAGSEFQVNTYTTSYQYRARVAIGPGGEFVVAWVSGLQDGSELGIFAQRHDAAGNRVGVEFRVNTYTTSTQFRPVVAVADSGSFVVAWTSNVQDGSSYGVFARLYDGSGNPQGAEFTVNSYTTGSQLAYGLAIDRGGNFLVTWNDDAGLDSFGRRFTPAGAPRGAEFVVNTYTTSYQYSPTASSDELGNFVVAWTSFNQDGNGSGVFAQRFGGLQPAALTVDGSGNSVWEPGEFVEMKPSWRNINGAAQSFGGVLSNITGPPGATYGIIDGSASYGTVPNNTSAACTDCYSVIVSNPASRPAAHWDAAAVETITPDAHGQRKQWLLHVGGSFTDVPASNPFYRFIETLLHHGVTGGCGAGTYCPTTATTRDQMSVFVLVAKEGAGYLPPACAPPNIFNDVPETNPFCRFIEELSNRGVVSGCGGGNYCPGSPVTREQMAIFVLRTLDPLLNPPACTTPMFADVPASSPFCRWIEELARRGVVSGCGGGNYCPAAAVTREQMGVFLSATFGLTLYGP